MCGRRRGGGGGPWGGRGRGRGRSHSGSADEIISGGQELLQRAHTCHYSLDSILDPLRLAPRRVMLVQVDRQLGGNGLPVDVCAPIDGELFEVNSATLVGALQ